MSQEWYYIVNGTQRGPITTKQLAGRAGRGRIRRSDLVWREGLSDWTEAGELKWLAWMIPAAEHVEENDQIETTETVSHANQPASRSNKTTLQPERSADATTYLLQLWNGEVSLAVTFWGLGLVGAITSFAFGVLSQIQPVLTDGPETMKGALAGILSVLAWTITNAYIVVSIWRSAGNSSTATIWKILARVSLAPLAFLVVYSLIILAITVGAVLFYIVSNARPLLEQFLSYWTGRG